MVIAGVFNMNKLAGAPHFADGYLLGSPATTTLAAFRDAWESFPLHEKAHGWGPRY